MSAQYVYAQPSHYGGGAATATGIPPAAYQTSYIPLATRIMAGHGAHYAAANTAQPSYTTAGGSSSVPYSTSIPSYQYPGYTYSGAGAPAASQQTGPAQPTQYSGSGTGASIAIQSFSSTTYSYSAGGVQTAYSISSVSTQNAQGGLDVYRSTSTKHYSPDGSSTVNYTYDVEQRPSPSSSTGVSPTTVTPTSSVPSTAAYGYPVQSMPTPQPPSIAPPPVPEKRAKSPVKDENWLSKDHRHVWQWPDVPREYSQARRSKSSHRDRDRGRYHLAVVPTPSYPVAQAAYEVEEVDEEAEARRSSRHSSRSRRRGNSVGTRESEAGFHVEEIEDVREPSALGLSLDGYSDGYGQIGPQALVPYKGRSRH